MLHHKPATFIQAPEYSPPESHFFGKRAIDLGDAVQVGIDQNVAAHASEHLFGMGGWVVFGIGAKRQPHERVPWFAESLAADFGSVLLVKEGLGQRFHDSGRSFGIFPVGFLLPFELRGVVDKPIQSCFFRFPLLESERLPIHRYEKPGGALSGFGDQLGLRPVGGFPVVPKDKLGPAIVRSDFVVHRLSYQFYRRLRGNGLRRKEHSGCHDCSKMSQFGSHASQRSTKDFRRDQCIHLLYEQETFKLERLKMILAYFCFPSAGEPANELESIVPLTFRGKRLKEIRWMETRTPEFAHIGKSVVIKGELSGSEDLYVDGVVEGTIELQGNNLVIGPNGRVRANINAKGAVVQGKLDGDIRASERTELRKSAVVVGDIYTQRIAVEDGAYFKGKVDIQREAAKPSSPGVTKTDLPHETKTATTSTAGAASAKVASAAPAASGTTVTKY